MYIYINCISLSWNKCQHLHQKEKFIMSTFFYKDHMLYLGQLLHLGQLHVIVPVGSKLLQIMLA